MQVQMEYKSLGCGGSYLFTTGWGVRNKLKHVAPTCDTKNIHWSDILGQNLPEKLLSLLAACEKLGVTISSQITAHKITFDSDNILVDPDSTFLVAFVVTVDNGVRNTSKKVFK